MYRYRRSSINTGMIFIAFAAILSMSGCILPTQRHYPDVQESGPVPSRGSAVQPAVIGSATISRVNAAQNTSGRAIHVDVALPPDVEVGLPFDYVIKVSNFTNEVVKDVVVIDALPKNLKVKSSMPKITELTAFTAKWSLGDLGPKEERVIQVTGVPIDEGILNFCTDVKYILPPVCLATKAVRSDLKITKTMPPEVLVCDTIPLTLVVTNPGTGIAHNVVVKEPLPPGLRTMDGKNSAIFKVGALQAGESRTIALEVKADRTGTFGNFATATGSNGLSAESNTTTTIVRQPVLNITKTGPERVFLGLNIIYNIEVSNVGDAPAESTILDDSIPANTDFVSASAGGSYANGRVEWILGTLQPRESRKVRLTLRSNNIGRGKDTATAKAYCAEAVAASATTRVLGIPAVLLEAVDLEDPINVGSVVTYVITVTNQGSATGTNIKIESTLEEGTMEYVSSSGPTVGFAVGNTITFNPLPSLAPKDKASWNLRVRAINPGDVRFKIKMNSDQIERDVIETEATNFYK